MTMSSSRFNNKYVAIIGRGRCGYFGQDWECRRSPGTGSWLKSVWRYPSYCCAALRTYRADKLPRRVMIFSRQRFQSMLAHRRRTFFACGVGSLPLRLAPSGKSHAEYLADR
jgi:hypothetical protein